MPPEASSPRHIRLTSHAGGHGALPIRWGAATPVERGPIVGTTTSRAHRNVIGTHSGSYSVYRALAVAAGALARDHRADLTNTAPTDAIGPYPQWSEPERIVSLDPWGAVVADAFAQEIAAGYDIRPTIAVTKAHVVLPEVIEAVQKGRLTPDGAILLPGGAACVTKAAIEPVWWLPGVARRFGCTEADLRRVLFEETGGMYPELVTRSDLEVFLPPIGGLTVYVFGQARDEVGCDFEADHAARQELGHADAPGILREGDLIGRGHVRFDVHQASAKLAAQLVAAEIGAELVHLQVGRRRRLIHMEAFRQIQLVAGGHPGERPYFVGMAARVIAVRSGPGRRRFCPTVEEA